MLKACLALAFFCLVFALPLQAFDWETATSNGREYVSLRSFCAFYGFSYQSPQGNPRFETRNAQHSLALKLGSPDMYLDGVHYVMSFAIEGGDHDWLVSRMDVIKLFEPIIRPTEISGRHSIRGVVIDAGHGGSDNGAGSRYGNEKTYTLDTANRLAKILNDAGIKTVFTRRSDVFVDLYERAHIASLYSDYAFVSLHYNSATPEAHGLETYCLSPRGAASTSSAYLTRGDIQKLPGNDYDTQNVLLASLVHSEVIKLNPGDSSADRGVKRARFVVIKQNVLPAILVEEGFVSNRMESARVDRPDYRQKMAQAIARGVIRFINVMGDKNMSLPGLNSDSSPTPAPKATPVTLPAPSGLSHDSANGKANAPAVKPKAGTTPAVAPTTSKTPVQPAVSKSGAATSSKSKKDKNKKTVATPELSKPPEAAPAPAPTPAAAPTPPDASPSEAPAIKTTEPTPKGALNLSEPATPTPTPGADKAPAEPDEPPTVNIYPTTQAPKDSAAPKETAPAEAPTPSTSATNAPSSTNP